MKMNVVETLVGAAVIAIAIVFFTYAYKTADLSAGSGGYSLTAQFERIDGVSTGTDVRMAGIKIGTVTGQKLEPSSYEAIITMEISPEVKLPTDSTAKITSEGLLGGNYVSLEPGGDENMLADGGRIENTQSSVDLIGLLGQAIFNGKGS